MPSFYEFFAGGGMARAGLGASWTCLFANDLDEKKAATYTANWGSAPKILVQDVRKLEPTELPGYADLLWSSFPCQDLSLAGSGAGLKGNRSGVFWPFWKLVKSLVAGLRAPKLIVLENVCGTLTSHGGEDFRAICRALAKADYRFGALIVDAALFVPQSRRRVFIIAVRSGTEIPGNLKSEHPVEQWHSKSLCKAVKHLGRDEKEKWIWFTMPQPAPRLSKFADLTEENPSDVPWHTARETKRLIALMSPIHRRKVQKATETKEPLIGSIYKRRRINRVGRKVQRAEVRFDDVVGCLRTPTGGSSRQSLLFVDGKEVKSRLISSRETARLMGLADVYILPASYNEAYHVTGDGVVVPVVRYMSKHILEKILESNLEQRSGIHKSVSLKRRKPVVNSQSVTAYPIDVTG